uniref:Uncharacterized protein n=1 Tax=Panagrolaimus davidi TaxID=227884 RepID=A0A914PDF8_9BILA
MLIEKELLDKLCPIYQKVVKQFEAEYSVIPSEDNYLPKREELLTEFSQNYFMLSNFWNEYFRIIGHRKSLKLERTRARKHFHNYKGIGNDEHGFKKLLHEQPNLYDFNPFKEYNPKENELILPRKRLDKSLRYYKEHSCKFKMYFLSF